MPLPITTLGVVLGALAACLGLSAATAQAAPTAPPAAMRLDGAWQVRDAAAAPPAPQPSPPGESQEGTEGGTRPGRVKGRASQAETAWEPAIVPSVFDADADPPLFGGTVKQYRLLFRAPRARSFKWAFRFEQVRRRATVFLNGRRIGLSVDPYTPFELEAKGLRPGKRNELFVIVDSRKDPRLPEGWWNWGGITRPVTLIPRGRVDLRDLGVLSEVACKGPATRCRAGLLLDGTLSRLPKERARYRRVGRRGKRKLLPAPQPRLTVRLRSPLGRVTTRTLRVAGSRAGRRRLQLRMRVPAPELWAPEHPNLYDARVKLTYRGRTMQAWRMKIGLRSVTVRRGLLRLNNRVVQLRGASIHEDMPGHGAALTGADMDTVVRELKELGANVTRSHYVLSEGLLRRLDRAGIMVWNQVPVWQRDHQANLLQYQSERTRALAQLGRTIRAARNHPAVITHSVANELTFTPDRKPTTRNYLIAASEEARDLDPTLPVALDIKGRPGFEEQFTYERFDILGINQYFGWYPWVEDFNLLEPYLREMRDLYPQKALVMTEFGAEGRPDQADGPPDSKGSYAFQTMHVARTLDLVDRLPFMSGAIHWTLREFEIFPGWLGGADSGSGRNTRHHKGLLTYTGERKPAWSVVHDHYLRTPLYR